LYRETTGFAVVASLANIIDGAAMFGTLPFLMGPVPGTISAMVLYWLTDKTAEMSSEMSTPRLGFYAFVAFHIGKSLLVFPATVILFQRQEITNFQVENFVKSEVGRLQNQLLPLQEAFKKASDECSAARAKINNLPPPGANGTT
jgi:hypothetical protein